MVTGMVIRRLGGALPSARPDARPCLCARAGRRRAAAPDRAAAGTRPPPLL